MAEQSLLIRIGIDPSQATAGGKGAEDALNRIDNRLVGLNQRFGEGAKVGVPFERMFTRMGAMPRIQVFNLLAQDLIYSTGGMEKLGAASSLARTGLFAVQGVASTLLGSAGFGAVAVAGLLVVSMFTKKAEATKQAREELDKNLKSLNENKDALLELAKQGDWMAREILEKRLVDAQHNFFKATHDAERSVMSMGGSVVEAMTKAKEVGAPFLITIQNIKKELQELTEGTKEWHPTMPTIKVVGLTEESEKLKKFNEDLQKILNPPAKPSIQLEFKDAKEGVDKFKQSVIITTGKIQAMNNTTALLEPIWDENSRKAEEFKNATSRYVGDLSIAFADMMMGVDVRWGDLLESMVKQLIASGIQSLIMGLLTGGVGGGLLGGIFGGFQSGTPFVPRTGAYILHQGEAVIPANQNVYRSSVFNQQSNYGNTYVQIIQLDPKKLTKDKIAPILKEMIKNREFNI